jgi:hypothetical protein
MFTHQKAPAAHGISLNFSEGVEENSSKIVVEFQAERARWRGLQALRGELL